MTEWLGYLEHTRPELLEHFTTNVGPGNCTIFAEMIKERTGVDLQGLPWCATFVFAVHPRQDILGEPVGGTRTLMRRMKWLGRWRGRRYRPKPGDLVFCRTPLFVHQVGIVLEADDKFVVSIDGKTCDPSGVCPPKLGGAVALRVRRRRGFLIAGYASIGAER